MKKTKAEKGAELAEKVNNILGVLVNAYMENMANDVEHNNRIYDFTNNEWKKYAQKINATQKLLTVSPFAFKNALAERIREVIKETDLKQKDK